MSTVMRPELSLKNDDWIPKYRYLELRYFCLQYSTWFEAMKSLSSLASRPDELQQKFKTNEHGDPTARCAMAMERFDSKTKLVERSAKLTDEKLWPYILRAVTRDMKYEELKDKYKIPCGRTSYYKLYRRFFFILSKLQDGFDA